MTQLFDEVVHPLEPSGTVAAWSPTADVVETPDGFEISLELAGIQSEAVQVEAHGHWVTVRGTRPFPSESGEGVHRMERRYGPFVRTFELPAEVDGATATRVTHEGVLRLSIARARV